VQHVFIGKALNSDLALCGVKKAQHGEIDPSYHAIAKVFLRRAVRAGSFRGPGWLSWRKWCIRGWYIFSHFLTPFLIAAAKN
jgi:hypothetical protein